MMDAEAVPTRPTDRIEQLDLLRGFAIFGILVVNMTIFSGSAWNTETTTGAADRLACQAIELLASGKFLNLFSFLFGVGFTLQLRRVTERSGRFAPLYSRRLVGLFLIGLIHGIFIASVDTLQTYALLGFLLLLVSRVPRRGLLLVAALCFLLPVAYSAIESGMIWVGELDFASSKSLAETDPVTPWRKVYHDGDYSTLVSARMAFWWRIYTSPDWYVGMLGHEFVLFLLGMYAGRIGFFENLNLHLSQLKIAIPWLAVSGIALTLASLNSAAYLSAIPDSVSASLQDRIFLLGALSLSGAYASGLIVLTQIPVWKHRLVPLALAGRMALTNYVLQSVICSLVFYESGLGLYDKVGPAHGLILTVVIFVTQVLLSTWWLRVARFGPLEWLWRCSTYRSIQPLLKSRVAG